MPEATCMDGTETATAHMDFKDFILIHENDDTARLLLSKAQWPDVDMSLAVNTIESRRKLKSKVPSWYSCPELVYPNRISAEQCSSEDTARLKADIAARLVRENGGEMRIADLTGGLGVDAAAFRKAGFEVLYNEMDQSLCQAAVHNFRCLGLCEGIRFSCCRIVPAQDCRPGHDTVIPDRKCPDGSGQASPAGIAGDFRPGIIFLDPARRDAQGRKVFLMEDCSPDILALKDELLQLSRFAMVKLSPMADIGMVLNRLGDCCREIHAIASHGDCRELLAVLDREHKGQVTYHAWESGRQFVFTEEEMLGAEAILQDSAGLSGPCLPVSGYPERDTVLFEPGKAMMKTGAFNLLCSRFGVTKLARFTHLYILPEAEGDTPQKTAGIAGFGKLFRIMEIIPLSNAGMKTAAGLYPDADVTARNIPLDSDALKARLYGKKKKSRPGKHDSGDGAITTGGRIHIFGLKYECGGTDRNLLLVTSPVSDTEARTRGWLP